MVTSLGPGKPVDRISAMRVDRGRVRLFLVLPVRMQQEGLSQGPSTFMVAMRERA